MDKVSEGVAQAFELHANEPISRLVAYSSQYLFWATVIGLSAAIGLLQ